MLIINPDMSEDERTALIVDIKDELTSTWSKIESEDIWWAKDLAYKIKWSKTGYYLLYILESEGDKFFDVTKSFNIKKDIWRHMFVRLED
jgi:ribosomal protein S6